MLASTTAHAVPATDETIEQLSQIIVVSMMVVCAVLGFIAGQQR